MDRLADETPLMKHQRYAGALQSLRARVTGLPGAVPWDDDASASARDKRRAIAQALARHNDFVLAAELLEANVHFFPNERDHYQDSAENWALAGNWASAGRLTDLWEARLGDGTTLDRRPLKLPWWRQIGLRPSPATQVDLPEQRAVSATVRSQTTTPPAPKALRMDGILFRNEGRVLLALQPHAAYAPALVFEVEAGMPLERHRVLAAVRRVLESRTTWGLAAVGSVVGTEELGPLRLLTGGVLWGEVRGSFMAFDGQGTLYSDHFTTKRHTVGRCFGTPFAAELGYSITAAEAARIDERIRATIRWLETGGAAPPAYAMPHAQQLDWEVLPADWGERFAGGGSDRRLTNERESRFHDEQLERLSTIQQLRPTAWYRGSQLGKRLYFVALFPGVAVADSVDYGNALYWCGYETDEWMRIFQASKADARLAGAQRLIHTTNWPQQLRQLLSGQSEV